jgi:hypothetical protein
VLAEGESADADTTEGRPVGGSAATFVAARASGRVSGRGAAGLALRTRDGSFRSASKGAAEVMGLPRRS